MVSAKSLMSGLIFMALAGVQPAVAGDLRVHISDESGTNLPNTVIFLEPLDGQTMAKPANPETKVVLQKGEAFDPFVTTLIVGDSLYFQNNDPITHHIYSFSEVMPLDLVIRPRQSSMIYAVETPGVIALGSSIQDHMTAFVYVAPTPLHGLSNEHGVVELKNIPDGNYRMSYWHYRIPKSQTRSEDIKIEASTDLDLTVLTKRYKSRDSSLKGAID